MLLTHLDRMRTGHAFLGTMNLDVAVLTERFQTRFQSVRLQPPEYEILAAFLARRWGDPISITRRIAAWPGRRQGGDGGFGDVDGVIDWNGFLWCARGAIERFGDREKWGWQFVSCFEGHNGVNVKSPIFTAPI